MARANFQEVDPPTPQGNGVTFGHTDAQRTGMLKQNEAKGWKDSRYGSNKNSPKAHVFLKLGPQLLELSGKDLALLMEVCH